MNGLQSGSPASQLAPQSYRNSSQNAAFQQTYNSSSLQQTPTVNSSLNTLSTPGTLQVVDTRNSGVLGVSVPQPLSNPAVANPSGSDGNFMMVALVILVLSVALASYFFYRFKKLTPQTERIPIDADVDQT